ncbi:MAG: hypothetical protein M1820_008989 [Bogoriella megaspora]|nr:MAG: hypothetical protein M1820_008989 [Bogoriella megaspora]
MTTHIPSITIPGFIFQQPAASIALPVVLGTAVGFSVSPKSTQEKYLALKQPPLHPPPQIFGPMWTVLYALMGYSAYRAWTIGIPSVDPHKVALTKQGATLYTVQLGLNLIWMPFFFRFKRPIEATVDIVTLTGLTGYLAYVWGQVDQVAGWALAPYVGWLGFATYLSAGAGYLNNWDFSNKERPMSEKSQNTKYVDEKDS